MRKGIEDMERQLREAGQEVEREFVFAGLGTFDGAGWVVRVDGEPVAQGGSLGTVKETLRQHLFNRREEEE